MSDEPPSLRGLDPDATGVIPYHRPRIADFIDGDPPLPLAVLLVVAGPVRGTIAVVDRLPAVVGRADDADHQFLDDTVSRHHCRLEGSHADGLSVTDMGSANGTRVNGHDLVGPLHLRDGDLLELGSATVLVKLVA